MADVERISVQQAHAKTKANQALLVCAYEDEAKCRMLNLDGSISFTSLQEKGFTNVKVLKGGVEAWKAAGYAMN